MPSVLEINYCHPFFRILLVWDVVGGLFNDMATL